MIRQLLLAYRTENKISVEQMAKRIGIEKTALWRFETGKEIDSAKLLKILNFITNDKLPKST